MRSGSLHHIEIYVSDLAKSVRFWGWLLEVLGYQEYQAWEKGRSWRLGDTYLVFVQAEDRFLDVPYHRCRVGLNHLAFHVGSRAELDAIVAELRERGARILYEDRPARAGSRQPYAKYFEDPDRIKVELVASGS